MTDITSLQNPKIKAAISLRDRRDRSKTGLFLIEGYRELKRMIDAGWKIETLFTCEEFFLGENESALIASTKTRPFSCSKEVFQKLSYRDRPDGLIAVAPQVHRGLPDLASQKTKNPFYLVALQIEKPGNLGTMLRSADAAGASGVILSDPSTDLFNPNVVRASVGTLFTQPIYEIGEEELLAYLKQEKITMVAATPSASLEFTRARLDGPLAILVGSEQYGLPAHWLKSADLCVRIPMKGVADSLNVSAAATLLLYEALRQRSN